MRIAKRTFSGRHAAGMDLLMNGWSQVRTTTFEIYQMTASFPPVPRVPWTKRMNEG